MPAALSQEVGIQSACRIHGGNADDDWPLKLIRPGEDNCCHVGQNLEKILKRRLDCGESASMVVFDLLSFTVSVVSAEFQTFEKGTYILNYILSAEVESPQPDPTQCHADSEPSS